MSFGRAAPSEKRRWNIASMPFQSLQRNTGSRRLMLSWQLLVGAAVCAGLSLVLVRSAKSQSNTGLSMYLARKLESVWPWKAERRHHAFQTVTDVAKTLWYNGDYGQEIASATTKTFPGFPLLVLRDGDGDGRADVFAYHVPDRSEHTNEFGAFFTDKTSTHPFWLLFNGGLVVTKSSSDSLKPHYINHQFVDRNQDGLFDVYITNDVDSDSDGWPNPSDTLLLYDENYDGYLDRGEHIISGKFREIEPRNGRLKLLRFGQPEESIKIGDRFFEFANSISTDIRSTLSHGRSP